MAQTLSSSSCEMSSKPARQAGLEFLRCAAMLMVAALHYLGKGGLLTPLEAPRFSGAEVTAWLLECCCIVAVNVYMLLSGYFLCTSPFRLSRLIELVLQVWMYSVAFGLLGALTGLMRETDFDTHFLLTLFFPISMNHYWFLSAYVFLYVLLPFVGTAVRQMDRRQLQGAVLLLLFVFSLEKSVLPVRLELDGRGYDCLWYLCVFVAGAYLRRFGVPFLKKKGRGAVLYAACVLLAFGGAFALRRVYLTTGSLGRMLEVCLEYNHVLPFLGAAGLFAAFQKLRLSGRFGAFICRISPYTLGVYLLHENLGFRYTWQKWLGAETMLGSGAGRRVLGLLRLETSPVRLVCMTLGAAVLVFAAGIFVEMLRVRLMRGLNRLLMNRALYRRFRKWVEGWDERFRGQA